MDEERITESPSWNDPRGRVMKTPDDVSEMLRLKACGWGLKRIARHLGCSHHTVKEYVAAGGLKPFKAPVRSKKLDGLDDWLRERFIRHRGNADVVRQDLLAEKKIAVSRRTLQRAVQPHRQALKAEALATTRFETLPGRQMQIDFGERFVEIGAEKIKVFMFVATLGYSRRVHVRAFRAEKQEHWFAGLESAFTTFGGVTEDVLMDNPRALVVRHDMTSRIVQFNDKLLAFAKHWGFNPRACAPYRARTKGKTERGVSDGTRTFTYDGANRVTAINAVAFSYGPDGKRVKKTSVGGTTTYFGSDFELSGTNWTKYLMPDVKMVGLAGNVGTVSYLHRDHLGSVRVITSTAGAQLERANYRPFGEQFPQLAQSKG